MRGAPTVMASPNATNRLALVRSPQLREIAAHVLALSDNEAAEVLLRHVALATGRPGTFAAGVQAVREVLGRLGVYLNGARLYDGSGLSRQDALRLPTILGVLALAAGPGHRDLRSVVTELPIAGFSGTLGYRFAEPGTQAARGLARAKTGTLTGVHGLAGVVTDRTGAVLSFALVADQVARRDTLDARDALDRLVARLAGCGCG